MKDFFWLQNGAGVHVRDRNNDTPLMCAIEFGHTDVILALVECGAHIQVTKMDIKRIILIVNKKIYPTIIFIVRYR